MTRAITARLCRAGRGRCPAYAAVWFGIPLALLAAGWLAGLRLNLTGSLPVGLYVASRGAPRRGALVLACLPEHVAKFAKVRGYVPRGGACPGGVVPVGKRLLAVPGDTVTVVSTGLLVNGVPVPNSRPLPVDRKRRPLPQLARGRYVVGSGEGWVVSSYSRLSFDSRYFGPVELAQVRSAVRRVRTAVANR